MRQLVVALVFFIPFLDYSYFLGFVHLKKPRISDTIMKRLEQGQQGKGPGVGVVGCSMPPPAVEEVVRTEAWKIKMLLYLPRDKILESRSILRNL